MANRKSEAEIEETTYLGARVPVKLAQDFERVADANDRTVSHELRRLMRERIERHDAKKEPAA